MLAEQEINRYSLLIDSAVEVSPPTSDSDVRFVHAPRSADRSGIVTPALLKLWDVALDPSQNCGVRYVYSALGHHPHQISIAEFVSDIPSHTENDDCAIEVAATKEG
jgi:hypothetical protein